MASPVIRAQQRAVAVNRLIEAANAAAQALGVEPVEIPTHHRDAAHLPTVQIERVTELLERITQGAVPAESSDAKTADDETAKTAAPAKPASTTTSPARRAEKPAKASKG